jgi:starch phosphorylase
VEKSTLAARLPSPLAALAELAYDTRWLWKPECSKLFAAVDERLFEDCGNNPIEMLLEASPALLARRAQDPAFLARLQRVVSARAVELNRPFAPAPPASPERPIAFLCSEFAVHTSLPTYAGGLGVLAGDYLKEASDRALPIVGVGLLYKAGYFHQRLDPSGWQHEYWTPVRSTHMPIAPAQTGAGAQVAVRVPIGDREVLAGVWQVRVGRVPLFLLDTDMPENRSLDSFITSRLYVGDRDLRLMQYLVLGVGGVRALRALEIDPAVFHLNEGHAAFAALELLRERIASGRPRAEAAAEVRERLVVTTHTPVAAGNETYSDGELHRVLGPFASSLGMSWRELFARGRPGGEAAESFGMTALALRSARAANGVSRRHGEVARAMWRELCTGPAAVPIGHVTNGVHVPTWISEPMAELLTKYLGAGWNERVSDPHTWEGVQKIPDEELWAVRCHQRRSLVEYVRKRSVEDRLARGDGLDYVEAAAKAFDPNTLTVGFARRVASYKRLHLLTWDIQRALALLGGARPIQVVIAGKAHPRDDEAKRIVQIVFNMKASPVVGARVAFLEDYDLSVAARLVSGCDVWINLPRPPLEASGTSGMKSAFNGGLNLSVLDGWWAEASDGQNGWGIQSEPGPDYSVQDAHDSDQLYRLLEQEVVPLFHDRDAADIPHRWCAKIKASLRSLGPRFNAARMLDDYCAYQYAGREHR